MVNASAAFRVCERRAVGAEQRDFSLEAGAVQILLPPEREQHVHHVVKHFVNILIPAMERTRVGFLSA